MKTTFTVPIRRIMAWVLTVCMVCGVGAALVQPAGAVEISRSLTHARGYAASGWSGTDFHYTNGLYADGNGSYCRIIAPNSLLNYHGAHLFYYKTDKPLDITEMTEVRFELYVSDPAIFNDVGVQFELTSSGNCDVEESSANITYGQMVEGGLKAGWNHVCVPIDAFGKGGCDYTRWNFTRIYNTGNIQTYDKEAVFAIDSFRFTNDTKTILISTCDSMPVGWSGASVVRINEMDYAGFTLTGEVKATYVAMSYTASLSDVKSVSAKNMSYLSFDWFVSDPAIASQAIWAVELSSSGVCDKKESQFNANFAAYSTSGSLVAGWNTIRIPLSNFNQGTGTDHALPDWGAINYFRLYSMNTYDAGAGITYAIKDVAFRNTDETAEKLDAAEMKRTEHKVPIWGCNEAWGSGEVNNELALSGSGCVVFRFLPNSINPCGEEYIGVIDATGMDTLEFDLYISDERLYYESYSGGNFEITSSGQCDQQELCWKWDTIMENIVGEPQFGGWNHVRLPLYTGTAGGSEPFRINHINYIRTFWLGINNQDSNKFLALDNIVMTDYTAVYQAQLALESKSVLIELDRLDLFSQPLDEQEYIELKEELETIDGMIAKLSKDARTLVEDSEQKNGYYIAQKKLWQYEKMVTLGENMAKADTLSLSEEDAVTTGRKLRNMRNDYSRLTKAQKASLPDEALPTLEKAEKAFKAAYPNLALNGSQTAESDDTPTSTPTATPTDTPTPSATATPTETETPTPTEEPANEPLHLTVADYVGLGILCVVIGLCVWLYFAKKKDFQKQ